MQFARWEAPFLFAKHSYKQAPVLKKAQANDTIVWSEEVSKKGTRRYTTSGIKTFYDFYAKGLSMGKPMHWYEDIAEGAPCKLFFDIDGPPGTDLEEATKSIEAVFAPVFGLKRISMVIIDASTERKASRHIICQNAVMKDIHHAKRLVQKLARQLPEHVRAVLDEGVYTKNRPFRLIGSYKYGRTDGQLVWNRFVDEWGEVEEEWQPDQQFMASLISYVPYLEEFGIEPLVMPDVERRTRGQKRRDGPTVCLDQLGNEVTRGYKYFPDVQKLCYWVFGRRCAWNGNKPHKSRWLMVKMDLKKKVQTVTCIDPQCKRFEFDFRAIPKKDLELVQTTISHKND